MDLCSYLWGDSYKQFLFTLGGIDSFPWMHFKTQADQELSVMACRWDVFSHILTHKDGQGNSNNVEQQSGSQVAVNLSDTTYNPLSVVYGPGL